MCITLYFTNMYNYYVSNNNKQKGMFYIITHIHLL